jgi:hypothetical protein
MLRVTEVPFLLRQQPARFERAFLISRFAAKPDKSQINLNVIKNRFCNGMIGLGNEDAQRRGQDARRFTR